MIGDIIYGKMKELKISQKQLGKILEEKFGKTYSQPTISKMLKDEKFINGAEIRYLCDYFKLPVSKVFKNTNFL